MLATLMVFEERIGFRKNGLLLVFGQTAMFFYLVHRLALEIPATYFGLRGVGDIYDDLCRDGRAGGRALPAVPLVPPGEDEPPQLVPEVHLTSVSLTCRVCRTIQKLYATYTIP